MRKFRQLLTTAITLTLLLWSSVGWGQVMLPHYDGINYIIGEALQTQTGWGGLNTGDNIVISEGSLTFNGLKASEGNKFSFDGTGMEAVKAFTSQTSGIIYYSFLLRITDLASLNTTGGYFTSFTDNATNFGATVWVKLNGTGFELGINPRTTAANTVWNGTPLNTNTNYFVVISYEMVAGTTNDVVKMWINPIPGSEQPTTTLTATNGLADLASVQRILIRQDGASTTPFIEMDEIRIGLSWADVTPAPAAADETAPVPTFSPANGATNVALNVVPTITFDEVIYTSAGVLVTDANVKSLISFKYDDGTSEKVLVDVDFSATITDKVITITPTADLSNEVSYTITMAPVQDELENAMDAPASATFTTVPAGPIQYAVTFSKIGEGTIAAMVGNDPITSGDLVNAGSVVVFTATPTEGYRVKQWTLNTVAVVDNTSNTFAIADLQAAATVTVEFEAIPLNYAVTFSVVGENGTLAATVNATPLTSGDEVIEGSNVVFTATPAAGYRVKEWTLNTAPVADNTTNTFTITNLQAAATVTVEFEAIPKYLVTFTVTDGVNPIEGAMVTVAGQAALTATTADGVTTIELVDGAYSYMGYASATLLEAAGYFTVSGSPLAIPVVINKTVVTEEFDYPVGSLLSAVGYTAHSGAGTNAVTIKTPSISFANYASSEIGNEIALVATGEDVNKVFGAQSKGTLYTTLLVNVTGAGTTGDYFFHLGPEAIGSTFRGRLAVKKASDSEKIAFGIGHSAVSAFTGFDFDLNTTYLIAIQYEFVEGPANDIVGIYINPVLGEAKPTTGWLFSTDTPNDPTNLGSFAFRQGSSTPANLVNVKIDGVRVSKVWEEAAKYVGSSDATLATFTIGGQNVLGLAGIVVANPAVDAGAKLFVSDFATFNGITAAVNESNATVTVSVNGTDVVEADWANYGFAKDDVVVASVEAEDGTMKYYKVNLVDTKNATIDKNIIEMFVNWENEPLVVTITLNDATEVLDFEYFDRESETWMPLPEATEVGTFWGVEYNADGLTATLTIYLNNSPSKSSKEGEIFTGQTESTRIVFNIGDPAMMQVKMKVKTFDLTFAPVDADGNAVEDFTIEVVANEDTEDAGFVVAEDGNVAEVVAKFKYDYTITAFGFATFTGTTNDVMEDLTIAPELTPVAVPKLISYWNFNTNVPAADQNWAQPLNANIGGGVLTYNLTQAYSFAGSTINGIPNEVNGGSFAARGGLENINNGRHVIFAIPTPGFEDIVLSYATRRTSTGFTTHDVFYTINGTDWLHKETVDITNFQNSWAENQVVTIDFTEIEDVNFNEDFAVKFVLTGASSEAGNTRFENVRVTGFGLNYETGVTAFSAPNQMTATQINAAAGTIALQVLNGTNLATVVPSFTLSSGAKAYIGEELQTSGVSVVDFTSPVVYTIVAENGTSTRDWTVTITYAPISNQANITDFTVPNMLGKAVIDAETATVNVVMPLGTNLTALVPTITTSLGATINPASGVAQDFTTSKTYTVTAQDASTKQWTVTVSNVQVLPISQIRENPHVENLGLYHGKIVATTGIVTANYIYIGNVRGFYIQDGVAEWSGIMIYTNSDVVPAIGSQVRVTGYIGAFDRVTQFTNYPSTTTYATVEVLSTGNALPEPVALQTELVKNYKWQSMILSVNNAECTHVTNMEVNDGSGALRLDKTHYTFADLTLGTKYKITGIGAYGSSHYRLRPRFASDIELVTSVNPVWGVGMTAFPNPFSNKIWIDNAENASRIVIVNLIGQQVMSVNLSGESRPEIDTNNLPNGIYLVTIFNNKGERTVRKMVKQ